MWRTDLKGMVADVLSKDTQNSHEANSVLISRHNGVNINPTKSATCYPSMSRQSINQPGTCRFAVCTA
jgi:hypothetical protein